MSSLSILVTGANGFVGKSLCEAILKSGYQLTAVVRDRVNTFYSHKSYCIKDLLEIRSWNEELNGVNVVIHLASRVHVMEENANNSQDEYMRVNLHGTMILAEAAAKAGVKRFIYVSTIGVHGDKSLDEPISEKSSIKPMSNYALSKWYAEQALSEFCVNAGMELVILRPPLIYGPNNPGNMDRLLRFLSKKLPLPLASARNKRSFIYIENFIDVILLCLLQPSPFNSTYVVSDGEDISTSMLIKCLNEGMGQRNYCFHFPICVLYFLAKLFRKEGVAEKLLGSFVVDSSKLRKDLNWHPRFSMKTGLQKTAYWYKEHLTTLKK